MVSHQNGDTPDRPLPSDASGYEEPELTNWFYRFDQKIVYSNLCTPDDNKRVRNIYLYSMLNNILKYKRLVSEVLIANSVELKNLRA